MSFLTRSSATAEIVHVIPSKQNTNKNYIHELQFIANSMGLASVNSTQLALKAVVLREITCNDHHWAV